MRRRDFFKFLPAAAAALPKVVDILAEAAWGLQERFHMWGISQSTYRRWKPYRLPSVTEDHPEITAHFEKLFLNATYGPLPKDHIIISQPGDVIKELGGSLDPGMVSVHSGVLERVGPGDVLHAISDGENHDDRGFQPTV